MTAGPIICLVPMKPLATAKRRLRRVLDPRSRGALALLMLDHVLGAVAGANEIEETRVVGGDRWVRDIAVGHGAAWLGDAAALNPALESAARDAYADGAAAVLILPADLGLITPADIGFIADAADGLSRTVLAKAARDGGTNALLAPHGMLPPLRFGKDSLPTHTDLCRRADIPCETIDRPGLAFDLDTPYGLGIYRAARPRLDGDLDRWRRRLPEEAFAFPAKETPA